jgi:hypothetical protein
MQNQISILKHLAKTLQKKLNKLRNDKTDMIFQRTTKCDWNLFEREREREREIYIMKFYLKWK